MYIVCVDDVHASLRVRDCQDTMLAPDILAMRRAVTRVTSFIARDGTTLFSVYLKCRIVYYGCSGTV